MPISDIFDQHQIKSKSLQIKATAEKLWLFRISMHRTHNGNSDLDEVKRPHPPYIWIKHEPKDLLPMTHFDPHKIYDVHGHLDLVEIRREASQMRAKAVAEFFSGLLARFRVVPTVVATEA